LNVIRVDLEARLDRANLPPTFAIGHHRPALNIARALNRCYLLLLAIDPNNASISETIIINPSTRLVLELVH
jgi:hypothetical protein